MVQSNLLWMLCGMQNGLKTWVSSHSLHYLDAIPLVLGPRKWHSRSIDRFLEILCKECMS